MTDENHQAYLLEAYLQVLQDDIDAVPPEGLDPAVAAFARKLIRNRMRGVQHNLQDVKARVWQRALQTVQIEETYPMTTLTYPVTKSPRLSLTMIAAVAVALLFATLIFVAGNLPGPDDNNNTFIPGAQVQETEEAPALTATANPSDGEEGNALPVVMTATPIQAEVDYAPVVVAYTSIEPGTLIDDSMLIEVLWPVESQLTNVFANEALVVGQYAQETIPQYMPLFDASVVQIQPQLPSLVSTGTPIPDGSSRVECVIHVVEEGDTLYSISLTYEVNLEDLLAVNGLNAGEENALRVGDELIIPILGCPEVPGILPTVVPPQAMPDIVPTAISVPNANNIDTIEYDAANDELNLSLILEDLDAVTDFRIDFMESATNLLVFSVAPTLSENVTIPVEGELEADEAYTIRLVIVVDDGSRSVTEQPFVYQPLERVLCTVEVADGIRANVRSQPDEQSTAIGILPQGTPGDVYLFNMDDDETTWYLVESRIESAVIRGWVRSDLLEGECLP